MPWSATGMAPNRAPKIKPPALVESLEPRYLLNSIHLKDGQTLTDLGTTLRVQGALAGLGNGDVMLKVTVTNATATTTCTSPGGNAAPGQNVNNLTLTGAETIPAGAIKNGNVSFDLTTTAPQSPVPGAPECPNPNWTETIDDVDFTNSTVILTVTQEGNTATFQLQP